MINQKINLGQKVFILKNDWIKEVKIKAIKIYEDNTIKYYYSEDPDDFITDNDLAYRFAFLDKKEAQKDLFMILKKMLKEKINDIKNLKNRIKEIQEELNKEEK